MAEKKTKRQQVIELLSSNKIKEAMKIAKTFTIEFNKEEHKTITRAYEMTHSPDMYEQLGFNAQEEFEKATQLLYGKYGSEIKGGM